MKIVYTESFTERLESQIRYISKDSNTNAIKFKSQLIKKIKSILNNPLLHRKSIYFNDESIRDLIFKGYTVVFKIHDSLKNCFKISYLKMIWQLFQAKPPFSE